MKTHAGVWIDHRRAFVVTLLGDTETSLEILSDTEKQLSRVDGVKSVEPFEPLCVKTDDRQEHIFEGRMEIFYKEVGAAVEKSDNIMLMGPGEAKDEFRKFIEKHGSTGKITSTTTEGKLTDRQIEERVRGFFAKAN